MSNNNSVITPQQARIDLAYELNAFPSLYITIVGLFLCVFLAMIKAYPGFYVLLTGLLFLFVVFYFVLRLPVQKRLDAIRNLSDDEAVHRVNAFRDI